MSCDPHALGELLFGELAVARAAALRHHLRTCPGCQAELAALERDRDHLRARAVAPPALDSLFRGIEARLAAPPSRRRFTWRPSTGLLQAALGACALVLAWAGAGRPAAAPSARTDSNLMCLATGDAHPPVLQACPVDGSDASGGVNACF